MATDEELRKQGFGDRERFTQFFKAVKHERNTHQIDEPDFDEAVWQWHLKALHEAEVRGRIDEIELGAAKRSYDAGMGATEFEAFLTPLERQRIATLTAEKEEKT
jgi:hypothetical protein